MGDGAPRDRNRSRFDSERLERFIARWQGREGGQERANYALFLSEFCDAIDVPRPDPADASTESNDYVFERVVREPHADGTSQLRRIDLYKRCSFVLEAKQSRLIGGPKEVLGQTNLLSTDDAQKRGRRTADRGWDVYMKHAREQAEGYARCLPASHGWPPFIIVCDVGHCFELYADFSGQGKNYTQFPDRQSFRIYLEDLRLDTVRERLRRIWIDPLSLDPARSSAQVTRDIAERLAAVSRALENQNHDAENVAMFFMRCIFTMFAEDVGLLPERSFRELLAKCRDNPSKLQPLVGQLWEAMDAGGFAFGIEATVKRFNGEFFRSRAVLPLGREEIGELLQAASHNWRDVEPAIFGTLLEQALDKSERKRLGAHYTPRAYVERLVVATVLEPLRAEWGQVLATAERLRSESQRERAVSTIEAFHKKLCAVRVLDPACGTGNFLYVSLELMKRLEGEVLEALADLGGQEDLRLEGQTVDSHQFLGLEINPRAAAIAELVLWIGYLQWHFRTRGAPPAEPILRAFDNIQKMDAVLSVERSLARDESGRPIRLRRDDGSDEPVYTYANPRRPEWPEAEFVVGNPPFIGGKDLRSRLHPGEAEALWAAHPHMNESADLVMYWWDHAAELLTRKATALRRFGLVTTNSISQVFQRRAVERHLTAKTPVSLAMAIPDHPWTKATPDAAAVRIAMTVVEAGTKDGILREVVGEGALDTDQPNIAFKETRGMINPDLTIGVDVTRAVPLLANEGLCSPGMKLHGRGFIVSPAEAELLGLGRRPGLERYIRHYRNGRDLTSRPRGALVIDLFGLSAPDVRARYPEVYQHLLATVKPERGRNRRATYKDNWWIFGEPRSELRPALENLNRYIVTVETTKHRVFQFLSNEILPDNMLVAMAIDDAFHLGVLSSGIHMTWAMALGGTLEDRPRYTKTECFNLFPFPDAKHTDKVKIRAIVEELDAHRKARLSAFSSLTLTSLYNVLGELKRGRQPQGLDEADRRVYDEGLVLILKELHEALDQAVADAYGWPGDLSDEEILRRLVALNKERAAEEARGLVRWLRPDYQAPRFGKSVATMEQIEAPLAIKRRADAKPLFPTDEVAQTASVMAALAVAAGPMDPGSLAATFRQGMRVKAKVHAVLDALYRMGYVTSTDKGRTFVVRLVA